MALQKPRRRPMLDSIKKFIADTPDLIYDGTKIQCVVCKVPLMCWSKSDCQRHVNSPQHKKRALPSNNTFPFDLCVTLILCNLPFTLLDNEAFVSFWNKYSYSKLPSRRTLRRNVLTSAREDIEKRIKLKLQNKKLWLCVGETTDRKKHSVVNVMVRTMEPHEPSSSILLASKRIENCIADEILKVVLDSFDKFELSMKQLLLFISDNTSNMLSLGQSLKKHSNFLHVMCKIHTLNLVAQTICECYPRVNALIAYTKAVFLKSPAHTREFHRLSPQIPEPPQPDDTCWGTWLQAAFYYNQYFDDIKNVILKFDPTEAADINKSQEIFQDTQVKGDLETIYNNYFGLAEGIEKLQNVSVSLVDSVRILDDIHKQLCAVEGEKNACVIDKLESAFGKDSDFLILRQICEGASQDPLSCSKDYFKYANITSLDIERSFSEFKNIYSAQRTRLAETTVETYLMIHIFNRCYPDCDFGED